MTTHHQHVIAKAIAAAAITFGVGVGLAAQAAADEPVGAEANPYTALRCACTETAPAGSAALMEEVQRGLQRGHSAWVPGLPPPTR
ncbi:hypothetical protein MSAS_24990 [Mycobacterium saskatchewanense]|uniref:Secreted protein n=1 Tax=Mycobacterium saskatchewanense TaxID=220927 RepID=A0AAJ3NQW9_9MYCO|nr:hypothetical protein [Mycobacterium saskatchewanense]ORW71387.1 hypothetical protein AWC23_14255 [Mycobacterium saskatchewanense]BBX63325.1 hypothetical protein MSAS_24990 [Mycobacterium saskatchewanense]